MAAAVADEIAGAADLLKGKTSGNPVAVVRGPGPPVAEVGFPDESAGRGASGVQDAARGASALLRPSETDRKGRVPSFRARAFGAQAESEWTVESHAVVATILSYLEPDPAIEWGPSHVAAAFDRWDELVDHVHALRSGASEP